MKNYVISVLAFGVIIGDVVDAFLRAIGVIIGD
jgi:hypothetical protein